ncbi:MAG: hypothetical protein WKG01_09285 [Kofleriaceae bacterium]
MGNLHDVMQTDPWRARRGAAIEIRSGFEPELAHATLPRYVHFTTAGRAIGRSRLATERAFVIIQPGGKWGYDEAFRTWFREHAHLLHDACFYIADEYAAYLEEYRIRTGEFSMQTIAHEDAHLGLHLSEHRREHLAFALDLLDEFVGDTWFSGAEPDSLHARAVAVLIEHASERWSTWFQAALLRGDGGDREGAIPLFERAHALAPAAEQPQIEIKQLENLTELDPDRALAFGRSRLARWVEASARADRWLNPIAPGIERVAELERTRGEPTVAATSWMDAVRTSQRTLAPRLYAIARLRAVEGRVAEAIDWLRVATLLDPALAVAAVDCGDFARLPGPALLRVLDLARDLDA